MVQCKGVDSIQTPFLVTGHTMFAPDHICASIANSYNKADVFNFQELVPIVRQYSNSFEE